VCMCMCGWVIAIADWGLKMKVIRTSWFRVGKDGNTVGLSSIKGSSLVHNYICFEFPAVF